MFYVALTIGMLAGISLASILFYLYVIWLDPDLKPSVETAFDTSWIEETAFDANCCREQKSIRRLDS